MDECVTVGNLVALGLGIFVGWLFITVIKLIKE